MGLKRFIIKKHLISEGKLFFTNFSAFISILGVSIGVASLLVVLSVTSGFQEAYRNKILSHSGEIFVRKYGSFQNAKEVLQKVRKIPGVVGATPIVNHQILLSSNTGDRGALLKGIDPDSVNDVTTFHNMVQGVKNPTELLKKSTKGVLVGRSLAQSLNIKPGENITITFPFNKRGKVSYHPRVVQFKVLGYLYSGLYDFDSQYIYTSIDIIHKTLEAAKIQGLELKVNNIDDVDQIAQTIRDNLGNYPYVVTTYKEAFSNLFQSLQYQKKGIGIVLIVLILLASFSIIGTLLIFVTQKEKDIALLKALGVPRWELIKLFVAEGTTIGFVGTILGFLIGFAVLILASNINFELNPDVYNITYIPVKLHAVEMLLVFGIAQLIALLATVYPAIKAARINPVDGISGRAINR